MKSIGAENTLLTHMVGWSELRAMHLGEAIQYRTLDRNLFG